MLWSSLEPGPHWNLVQGDVSAPPHPEDRLPQVSAYHGCLRSLTSDWLKGGHVTLF